MRKLARPFPQAQLSFLGKQRGFWAELLVRQQIKERCLWGLQWEKYFRIQDAVLSKSLLLHLVPIYGSDSLV